MASDNTDISHSLGCACPLLNFVPANPVCFQPANTFQLWKIRYPASAAFPTGEPEICSQVELAYAATLQMNRDRFLYLRRSCRRILGAYMAVAPAAVYIEYGPKGKPYIAWPTPAPQFNLSHSGDLCLLAISPHTEIGLDVEQIKPRATMLAIAKRMFDPKITDRLLRMSEPQQIVAFYCYWTRLEAKTKAKGSGLFDLNFNSTVLPMQEYSFIPAAGYIGCIAGCSNQLPSPAQWQTLDLNC